MVRLENAKANCFGKIWVFWRGYWDGEVLSDTIQQLTIKFTNLVTHATIVIIVMYCRCSVIERLELWEDLEWIAENTSIPWVIGGDFNAILDNLEKLRELPVTQIETTDFA